VEEKEKKKRTLEYLQQLWNEVLEEDAALLEGTKGSQVIESKCKEVVARDKERQQPFKKAKEKQQGKYLRNAIVKIEMLTPMRDV